MKIRTAAPSDPLGRSDLLVGLAFERSTPDLGKAMTASVAAAKATGDVSTDVRTWRMFHRPDGAKGAAKRLGLIGMGKRSQVDGEALRRAAAIAQHRSEAIGVGSFEVWINAEDCGDVSAFDAGVAIAEGLVLGAYRYQPPRKEKPKPRKGQSAAVRFAGAKKADFERGFKVGKAAAEATVLARDVENMAPNHATPAYLASQARKLDGPKVKVKVLERKDLERLKMGAFIGVAKGSVKPPKLIIMDHNPAGAKKTVCVVGKGLTFDSGGISIKPSARMDEMRYDMCGGGAVLGLFKAIAAGALTGWKGKVRVVGIIGACENMPDAAAQNPGDVVTACNGTTIEILNTDAEGRLVLADCLAYAVKTYSPDRIVDLATLTGAVIVALGHECAGVMGNDDAHIGDLIEAGNQADEPLWQLPLWDVHREQTKSRFADIANLVGQQHGNGTIAGAAFLSYFVGDTKWAHIDIAGTAWGARARDYYRSGAAGTAVRTLVRWVRSLK